MKKIIRILILSLTLLLPHLVYAHTATQEDIDSILQKILSSQSVTEHSKIDCSLVTNEQFESLGDAVMSNMHQDEERHEFMDNMMGGEGSTSLQQSHINMGKQYLGCTVSVNTVQADLDDTWMHGMMGDVPFHMGNYYITNQWLWIIGILILFFGIIAGSILIILFIWKNQGIKKKKDPVNILKERFAKGEINREEYEHMKNTLNSEKNKSHLKSL